MRLLKTIKETFYSSFPLAIIIILCLCFFPMQGLDNYIKVIIGYASVVIGQSLFLVGLDSSILPIGHMVGSSFSKYNKVFFVLSFGLVFGLLATVAEPALAVLARQINKILPIINTTVFIWITAFGIGVFVALALYRMLKNFSIKILFAVLYALVFILVLMTPEEFISIAFDGSGATTGDVSVPFILALGIGISATFSKNKTNEESLGIIGLASVGPIIAVLLYGVILKTLNGGVLPEANEYVIETSGSLGAILVNNLTDVALAVLPIVIISVPLLIFILKLPRNEFIKLIVGVVPAYLGLLIFLSGIDYGFQYVGQYIGQVFFDASKPDWFKYLLLLVGFVLGAAITVSEPAVTVLGDQIEELTNGHIKKSTIKITLAIGIGFASLLSILKILTELNILYFLVPLYIISIALMPFAPKLFVGLAYDSGGVTGGALTSAFLTPLTLSIAQQVAITSGGTMSVLTNGFGIISFISVTPIIAVQVLGIIYDVCSKKAIKSSMEDNFEELQYYISSGNITSTKTKRRKNGKK